MGQPGKASLVIKYVAKDSMLLVSVLISMLLATVLSAGAPIYLKSLEQLAFNTSLERLPEAGLLVHVLAPKTVLSPQGINEADNALDNAILGTLSEAYIGHEKYLRGNRQLVGHPEHPIPNSGVAGLNVTRGFLQYLSSLENHVQILEGRMPLDRVTLTPEGPELDAVVSEEVADGFDLQVTDLLRLRPTVDSNSEILVRIVGVIESGDPSSEFWRFGKLYMETPPLELNIPTGLEDVVTEGFDIPEVHMLPMFVTEKAMVDAVTNVYPGALAKPNWFILLDKHRVTKWSVLESGQRMASFRDSVISSMPGSAVTAVTMQTLIDNLNERRLLTQIPMLVLMLIMVSTILFFMVMMVSYIVSNRERDASLLRSRGASIFEILRLYSLEGIVMVLIAMLSAPFIALIIVASTGMLPYFEDLTHGNLLPIRIDIWPFSMAALASILCLTILVIPGTAGARMGLLIHKLRSSRPPTTPFFHRYNIDIALLVIGSLVFWELNSRDNIVSGGLFQDAQVNDTLLIAPVLFLVVVGLLFMRLFPLFLKYISGESPRLVHLVAYISIAIIFILLLTQGLMGSGYGNWPVFCSLVALIGITYWTTTHIHKLPLLFVGIAVQASFIVLFLATIPVDDKDILYLASIGLIVLVPAQLLYLILQLIVRTLPVWLSIGLIRMARSPLQYTWLILLLVLATGMAIFSTTVGGTLEASQIDQAQYNSGTDLRVAGFTSHRAGGLQGLLAQYMSTTGIKTISLGYRSTGTAGPVSFELLGLEADNLSDMFWYRSDFSEKPIDTVLSWLRPEERRKRLMIQEEITSLGAWVKPIAHHPAAELWVLVQDNVGFPSAIKLGGFKGKDWQLMSGDMPDNINFPITLVAFQIVEPSFLFGLETPGALLFDDIHFNRNDVTHILEDFEGNLSWTPIITSDLSSDQFALIQDDTYSGLNSGALVFGSETDQGYRGFYHNPNPGALPVIASSTLLNAMDANIDDVFLAKISGRRIPVVVTGVVDYFPTLHPSGGRFFLTDMDSVLRHLNILGSAHRYDPNELFIKTTPDMHQQVRSAVDELVNRSGFVVDGIEDLETIRLDPLITAGWRPMVLLSAPIAILVVSLGYLAYLLLLAKRSGSEIGLLRTIGVSRIQISGVLVFENLLIFIIGISLGTWAGFEASALMVSPLAIGENGESVVPPFQMLTNWSLMIPTYFAISIVLFTALFFLSRRIGRLNLGSITRTEAN